MKYSALHPCVRIKHRAWCPYVKINYPASQWEAKVCFQNWVCIGEVEIRHRAWCPYVKSNYPPSQCETKVCFQNWVCIGEVEIKHRAWCPLRQQLSSFWDNSCPHFETRVVFIFRQQSSSFLDNSRLQFWDNSRLHFETTVVFISVVFILIQSLHF